MVAAGQWICAAGAVLSRTNGCYGLGLTALHQVPSDRRGRWKSDT
jgi:hypothetical protein